MCYYVPGNVSGSSCEKVLKIVSLGLLQGGLGDRKGSYKYMVEATCV